MVDRNSQGLQRRVAGYHDIRLDGIGDLLFRARGASVLDIGCNRGLVGFEFANNGARLVHGCDSWEPGITTAREIFADLRAVESKFEVVDLAKGPSAMNVFGQGQYDIILLLAVIHKIARVMSTEQLIELIRYLGNKTTKYLAWRSTAIDPVANKIEEQKIDETLRSVKMKMIQHSTISDLGPSAIWAKA